MFPALDLSLDSQSATTLSLLLLLPVLARAWAPLGEAQTDASSHLNKGCCRTGVRLAAREPANLPTSTATADPSHESYIEELRQFNSDRFQAAQNDPQAHSYTYEPNSSPEGTEEGWYDLAGTGLDFNVGSETPRGLAAPKSALLLLRLSPLTAIPTPHIFINRLRTRLYQGRQQQLLAQNRFTKEEASTTRHAQKGSGTYL